MQNIATAGSYGCAYQFIFCLLTLTFFEVLGVSGVAVVVQQPSGHLNPILRPSSMPLLLNRNMDS